MGDARFSTHYERIRDAADPVVEMRRLSDEDVISALAAASREGDPYLANVLATEAHNRVERASTITRSMGDGVCGVDARGRVTFMNAAAEDALGWSRDEAQGRDLHALVHMADRGAPGCTGDACPLARVLSHGAHTERHEDEFVRKNGRLFPVTYTASPVLREGDLKGAVVVFQDDSERRRAEAALRESEERFRTALELSPAGIALSTLDGRIIKVNRALCETLGYDEEELLETSPEDISHPEDLKAEWAEYERLLAGETQAYHIEKRFRHKDGHMVWMLVSASLVRDDDDVPLYAIGVARDITERKRQTALLEEQKRTLEGMVATSIRDLEERRHLEEKFRAILEATPDALVITDEDGVIRIVNAQAIALFGYSREEFLGRPVEMLMPDAARARHRSHREGYMQAPTARPMGTGLELAARRKDGATFPAEISLSPIHTRDGPLVSAAIRDVTERNRTERELTRKREQLEVLGTVTREITAAKLDTRAIFDGVTRVLGERVGDACAIRLLSEDGTRLLPATFHHREPSDAPHFFTIDENPHPVDTLFRSEDRTAFFVRGRPVSGVQDIQLDPGLIPRLRKDGVHDLAIVPITAHNRTLGALCVARGDAEHPFTDEDRWLIREVAERTSLAVEAARAYEAEANAREVAEKMERDATRAKANLEERVAARTRELRDANEELESFSSAVSHDLRAPLRGIGYFAQAFEEEYGGALDDTAREYLDRMRRETRRMSHLVEDFLTFSRAAHDTLHKEDVDVTALTRDVVAGCARADPDRRVDVRVQEGLTAHADPALLRVVMENLISNAWKFTRRAPSAVIEVGAARNPDGEVVYHVRDNGAGFDMAHAERLFKSFTRLHSPTEFEGTGIGLATVHRIVQRHGGRIWAEGRVGEGATFRFTL